MNQSTKIAQFKQVLHIFSIRENNLRSKIGLEKIELEEKIKAVKNLESSIADLKLKKAQIMDYHLQESNSELSIEQCLHYQKYVFGLDYKCEELDYFLSNARGVMEEKQSIVEQLMDDVRKVQKKVEGYQEVIAGFESSNRSRAMELAEIDFEEISTSKSGSARVLSGSMSV